MKRRGFIGLLGGAAAWPLVAHAQQGERMRTLGVLMNFASSDPEAPPRAAAIEHGMKELGWTVGRNLRIEYRWSGGDAEANRRNAAELVALRPDVIIAAASPAMLALQQATSTVAVVFLAVTDPVGAGYVASLARPGGNATGFVFVEYGISGKWLELLKEIAPQTMRVAVLRDPNLAVGIGQLAAIQSAAPSLGLEVTPVNLRDAAEIERGVTAFARGATDALIVTASPLAFGHRDLIVSLALKHKLPALYPLRFFVSGGGLISYGPDTLDQYRRATGYVDRILKGEKPADLPVQAPTRYELSINLKTAKALGLDVPQALLARADAVIE